MNEDHSYQEDEMDVVAVVSVALCFVPSCQGWSQGPIKLSPTGVLVDQRYGRSSGWGRRGAVRQVQQGQACLKNRRQGIYRDSGRAVWGRGTGRSKAPAPIERRPTLDR
jgi:hypothetical protein